MIDYHIHTNHSVDADGTISEYCERAVDIGLKEICFTNHCELDTLRDDNLMRFANEKQPFTHEGLIRLQEEVLHAKDVYKKSGLSVKFGLEIGYYDGIELRLQEILDDVKFDFLLGSIHCLDHICIDSSKEHSIYFSKNTIPELLKKYFQAIEKLISSRFFNAVGHLDVYKKYGFNFYGKELNNFPYDYLKEIFRRMGENEVALEINTAGLRRVKEFYPSPSLMQCARKHGVKMVTIGSDAHKVEDLGKGIKEAIEYAKSFGFDAVYGFDQRKPIEIRI